MIQIIREYKVKPETHKKFEAIFNKESEWSLFFRQSKAYKSTELIVKDSENQIYITIDKWKSIEHYDQFIKSYNKEYKLLNNKIKELTFSQQEIGIFSEE